MSPVSHIRIALANIEFPTSPDESVTLAKQAIADAAAAQAAVICFPEAYVPGYRTAARSLASPDQEFLDDAWAEVANAARANDITVILGTERVLDGQLLISTLVIDRDGTPQGFQDKVQLDPSEEGIYTPGLSRRVFQAGPLTFGVAICH